MSQGCEAGTFKINYRVSKTHKAGYQISLVFEITQNSRDELLLRALIKQLGCGGYYYDITNNTGTLTVTKFSDILNIIIPLFIESKILGIKALDFSCWRSIDWYKAAQIINKGDHLSSHGAATILALKNGINKKRKISTTFSKSILEGPFYIYNQYKTVLYFYTTDLSYITLGLNIQESAFKKHLNNGTIYLKNLTLLF